MSEEARQIIEEHHDKIGQIVNEAKKHKKDQNPWFAYENAKAAIYDLLGWTRPEVYDHIIQRVVDALEI